MNGGTCLRLNSLAVLKSLKTKKPRRAFGSPPWKTRSTSPTKPWKFCGTAVGVAELNPGGRFVGVVFTSALYKASPEAAMQGRATSQSNVAKTNETVIRFINGSCPLTTSRAGLWILNHYFF